MKGQWHRRLQAAAVVFFGLAPCLPHPAHLGASAEALQKAPASVLDALAAGKPQEVLVLFDDAAVEAEAQTSRRQRRLPFEDSAILAARAQRYRDLKRAALTALPTGAGEVIREYSHLPLLFQRFRSKDALERLLARPEVLAVMENTPVYRVLAQSLPLIDQPAAAAIGYAGTGATVAVLDTGIDYTLSAFGSCSAPGVPAGCRVVASVDVTGNGLTLNGAANNHGTNVSGVVAGVAPGAGISVNVFSGTSSSSAWVIDGINWAIANQAAYGIAALNMSLGDGLDHTSPCRNSHTNPYLAAINNARAAGILPVAAAGNNAYIDGIASPACTPGVVSVGAVYDSNIGSIGWNTGTNTTCTDSTTAADQITCFSNSASFLTMLAPGAWITAAGIKMAGTSQASPHVAGAAAVLRAGFPAGTLDQTVARLAGGGVPITDPRNAVTTPRLDLLAALGAPANDNLAAAQMLGGDSGLTSANNANAGKESGEPNHAGNAGGSSVWWSWTPASSGLAAIDTHGSAFDTLLAVYTGTSLDALTAVASNDNDGSPANTSGLTFAAQAGTRFLIAVDGYNGAFGSLNLDWSLTPQADLAVSVAPTPTSPVAGSPLTYAITVTNNGPSAATGVVLSDALPAGETFISASNRCSAAGGSIACQVGTVEIGGSTTVQITVSPAAAGTVANTVSVTSDVADPLAGNNSATADVVVQAAPEPVPALSPWGVAVTGVLLVGMAGKRRR